MARKKKDKPCEEMASWLITFSDMMTLMLTFFVLLVSMSRIDERRKLVVLGSLIGTFGFGKSFDALSVKDTRRTIEPGVFEDVDDLELLKPLLWEDAESDLRFESRDYLQVFSISAELLFDRDSNALTARGIELLDRILPILIKVEYPLTIAGHTASLRDELGGNYKPGDAAKVPDLSWKISLNRALTVYRYLIENGMDSDKLIVEAFGRFHPHYNNSIPKERMRNRRVDIVLDKRSSLETQQIKQTLEKDKIQPDTYEVDGFIFDVNPVLEN